MPADQRVTVANAAPADPNGRCVLYWMQRAQRGRSNLALDRAIHAANELRLPLLVAFGLSPGYPGANLRHFAFMLPGISEAADDVRERGAGFVVRLGPPDEVCLAVAREQRAALLVGDENPVRIGQQWRQRVAAECGVRYERVDADVVVPSACFPKEEWSAATLRRKLTPLLPENLIRHTEPRPENRWPGEEPDGLDAGDWRRLLADLPLDRSVTAVPNAPGGRTAGLRALRRFVDERLTEYGDDRNKPEVDGTSRLSPHLHFGQVSALEVALAVQERGGPGAESFLEELIVRRELAINFVARNPRYDELEGCPRWALETLAKHASDPRQVHDLHALEAAETDDPLWNAAQQQMLQTGYMSGYMRMLWAKKILQWSATPDEAFRRAVYLNDKYQLDGRDPNGYNGIAWSIGGKHDRPWGPERPIFGLVRYMTSASATRKFDAKAYIRRWLPDSEQPTLF